MSLGPRPFFENKHCFIYCGDDKCDCQCSPHYPPNILNKEADIYIQRINEKYKQMEREKLHKPGEKTDEQAYDDAMGILKEEKGNE